jgi:hypothetical protein
VSLGFSPPPVTANLNVWAQNVVTYLRRTASRLQFKPTDAPATDDGLILWDAENGYPTVSKDGQWRQMVLADGQYMGGVATDQTAAAINTAYKLTYTASSANGIANDGTNPERIVFDEAGEYLINFSAQISAGASSNVDFYFWPRVNGSDAAGSTMVNSLKNNNARLVVSRSAIFDFNAGDYLEVMWAVSDTNGILDATAATAFCPAAPASTISITRIRA